MKSKIFHLIGGRLLGVTPSDSIMPIGSNPNSMNTITNRGSLMTWAGTNTCLGYLVNFPGHGIFEPNAGKVDVTTEEATKHNQCLSAAEIKGLENCQVGQGCTFYFSTKTGVSTWMGEVVAPKDDIYVDGTSIQFTRNGMTFRGRGRKNEDCIFFKRIS